MTVSWQQEAVFYYLYYLPHYSFHFRQMLTNDKSVFIW